MWKTKYFKSAEARDKWIEKNQVHYEIVEIFVNNAFALEVRKLRVINL